MAGLVTGQDLMAQLSGKPLGERLLIPDVMLKFHEDVFLDDVSLEQVSEKLGVLVETVSAGDGYLLLAALLGEEC